MMMVTHPEKVIVGLSSAMLMPRKDLYWLSHQVSSSACDKFSPSRADCLLECAFAALTGCSYSCGLTTISHLFAGWARNLSCCPD